MKGYNNVQCDRMWIRRILKEEKTMVDSIPYTNIQDVYTSGIHNPISVNMNSKLSS